MSQQAPYTQDSDVDGWVMDEAKRLTTGDRQSAYGRPIDDWTRTGMIASAILSKKLKPGESVTAEDMLMIMIGVKMSRQSNRSKRDNVVDMAGYVNCLDMTIREREKRETEKKGVDDDNGGDDIEQQGSGT